MRGVALALQRIQIVTAGLLGVSLLMTSPAKASGGIGEVHLEQVTCHSVTMSIHIGLGWEPSPNPHTSTYRVWHISGPDIIDDATSDNSTIQINNLPEFSPYHFVIEARSRHKNGAGIPLYRKVDELKGVTPHCTVSPGYTPGPNDFRLRHELTSKCMYGSPVDGGPPRMFTCWKDPEMAIAFENAGSGEVRIRFLARGKCAYADPNNGGIPKNFTCWPDPNMTFIMESLGNNRYRFKHKLTQRCLSGTTIQGGTLHNWDCWDDPNMVFVKDPWPS